MKPIKRPEDGLNRRRTPASAYVPPARSKFLPVSKRDFETVARAAGFLTLSKIQVDSLGEVGRYLKEIVGAENLGITYIARSHEMSEVLASVCDKTLAECKTMEDRVLVIKLLQTTAKQIADNGKLLIDSHHLAIESQATIIQTNRSAPPGATAVPVTPPPGVIVKVEPIVQKT